MAVGKGSILRAANAAGTQQKEAVSQKETAPQKKAAVRKAEAADSVKEKAQPVQDIHEEKFKVITSLKDDMPVYLL